jgi:hypothetical protein
MKKVLLLVLTIIIVLCGCNKPKFTCKIVSPQNGAEVAIHKDLVVIVETSNSKSSVASVTVYLDNLPYPSTLNEPYITTIPYQLLTLGKHTIKALAINSEGGQAETSISITIVESSGGDDEESPAFVNFANGIVPPSWKTSTWVIETAFGFDDYYSLRADKPSSIVTTNKTMNYPSYVEFLTRGDSFVLYIDGVKAQQLWSAATTDANWKKWVYAFEKGKRTFRWENAMGQVVYLDNITFASAMLPQVTTNTNVSNITGGSAVLGGVVTGNGNHPVKVRGVCWNTSGNPTVDDDKTENGSGMGNFISYLTGLKSNTSYYVRAYATNAVGTAYGEQVIFTTLQAFLPQLTTASVTDITMISAKCGGNVTNDGNSPIIERGVCWSTSEEPTINDDKTTNGTGTGSFTSQMTGLNHSTLYYVRAYATNGEGTAYGEQRSFTTSVPPFSTPGYYSISLYDYYGDGWHGENFVSVKVGDSYVLNNITLNSGSGPYTKSFYVGEGQSVSVYFITSGGYYSYPGECYYKLFTGSNGTGTLIYTSPRPPEEVVTW